MVNKFHFFIFFLLLICLALPSCSKVANGRNCDDGICVILDLGPIHANEPATVTITVESLQADKQGMKVSLSTSDPDIKITGENNWVVDLKVNQPQHFSTTIVFPSREGYFDVVAGALDAQRGKMYQSYLPVRLTAMGGTAYPKSNPIPDYTPIVIIGEGTKLPSEATIVTIEQLTTDPQQFADQFVEVQGFNEGDLQIPACSPWYGPKDHWGLSASSDSSSIFIKIKNGFGGIIDDWGTVYNTTQKKAAVWGWWRLYDGPVGCGQVDSQGKPLPPALVPGEQFWYLDAVKLQWLESIDVPTATR